MRHLNGDRVEEATGVPQAESGADEGQNGHPKPDAEFYGLMIRHCQPPPGGVLIPRVRRQYNCVSLVRAKLPGLETYPLVGD